MDGKRMALTGAGIVAAAGIAIGAASLASASGTPTSTNGYAGAGYGFDGQNGSGGAPGGPGGPGGTGGRMGAQGQSGNTDPSRPMRSDEQLLTGDVAAKVTAAAKAKEPTATIERVETDSDGVYEAHMVRSDGTHVIVQVDKAYAVTGVQEMGQGGPGGPGAVGLRDGQGSSGSNGSNGQPGDGYGAGLTPALPTPSSTA